jgi:transposase
MLGHKIRDFRLLTAVSLEDLVPEDNFYRQVERSIDLSFVRDLADEFYSNIGRPSIDPVVFFKLQLIAFFEGIRSERQLMETVNLNLAHRWFIGYDLDEPFPDHSSLGKIRERYGLEAFQLFFEHIVELCIEAGLVWGEELYFDSTKVQANSKKMHLALANWSQSTMASASTASANLITNASQTTRYVLLTQIRLPCTLQGEVVLSWGTVITML